MSDDLLPPTHADPEKKKVLNVYGAFGACLLFSLIPNGIAALVSLLLFIFVLIWAYSVRSGNIEKNGLADNHITFIIRTMWIGSSLAVLTVLIASIYLLAMLDNDPLMPCIEDIYNVIMNMQNILDSAGLEDRIKQSLSGCQDNYLKANFHTFIISATIAIAPVILYFVIRYVRGLSRAVKGYRLANAKSWL